MKKPSSRPGGREAREGRLLCRLRRELVIGKVFIKEETRCCTPIINSSDSDSDSDSDCAMRHRVMVRIDEY